MKGERAEKTAVIGRTTGAKIAKTGAELKKPENSKKATYLGIKKWLENNMSKIEVNENEKQVFSLLTAVNDWWTFETTNRRSTSDNHNLKETLKSMQLSIDKLKKKIDKPTYAAALQSEGGNIAGPARAQRPIEAKTLEKQRKLKFLIINIADLNEKAKIKTMHPKKFLAKADAALGANNMSTKIKRLSFKNLIFQITSVKKKTNEKPNQGKQQP